MHVGADRQNHLHQKIKKSTPVCEDLGSKTSRRIQTMADVPTVANHADEEQKRLHRQVRQEEPRREDGGGAG